MAGSLCTVRSTTIFLVLIYAVPIAVLVSLERAKPTTHEYRYHSAGFFRECAKWDAVDRRFFVSFVEGGVGQIIPKENSNELLQEVPVVKDVELAGNASAGLFIDRERNRLLVVFSDMFGNRYSALAAYDLSTWRRLFLAQLSGPSDEKSLADDVAIDSKGNAYVTDAKASKIWKVDVNGKFQSTIRSPLFVAKEWHNQIVQLNGIVYHPDGFLVAVHTFSGNLYKIDISNGNKVTIIDVVGGPLRFSDGLLLLSPSKIVVAGQYPSARLVESLDGWETATVLSKFKGPLHRIASAATLKDGRIYLNHALGFGYPKKNHALVEAVFSP